MVLVFALAQMHCHGYLRFRELIKVEKVWNNNMLLDFLKSVENVLLNIRHLVLNGLNSLYIMNIINENFVHSILSALYALNDVHKIFIN